ncbi:MAG: protein kinase [Verrucomicrobia bacterium]|nr:protein kinase [Verrucomicrobiota bacterium]
MAQARTCSTCGAAVPSHAPAGHCPVCLLRIGLGLAPGRAESSPRPSSLALPKIRSVGDYELLEEISSGGMGVVFKARQLSLNRFVAVKLIRAGQFANETEVARFRSEAEAAAQLDHPNIVPIYEVGEHDGRHYFSMKLIEGRPLSAALAGGCWRTTFYPAQRPPRFLLPGRTACCPTAAQLIVRVARAVHYAHQHGLLHRDLKPGNVLLDTQGQPHVTDFGLAKRIEAGSAMTLSGAIVGTPSYMAPEQAAGARVLTTAADIYSLGAILYELLTGRPPFVGATVMETLHQVVHEEALAPWVARRNRDRGANPKSEGRNPKEVRNPESEAEAAACVPTAGIGFPTNLGFRPSDLDIICLKCLEKDPARRYGTAEALAEDLDRWLRGEPIQARPSNPAERLLKWARRKPAIAMLSASAALALALGVVGVFWQWREAVAARAEAQQSAANAERELRGSQLAQLQLVVGSRRAGHRLESLRLIQTLARHAPSAELRDLAITALGSSDARMLGSWRPLPLEPSCPPAFDGQLTRVALGDASGEIRLYSFPELQPLGQFTVAGATAGSIAWADRERALAAALTDGRVVLWDVASARVLFATNGCSGPGRGQSFAVHPGGTFLAMSGTGPRLRAFDLDGSCELPAVALPASAESLAFDSAGDKLAVSFLDHFQVREFPSLKLLTEDAHPKYFANQMVWEPGDRWLLAAMQGWNVLRWHPGMGTEGQILGSAHDAAALSLCRNDAGSLLLSSGADNTSYLWEARYPTYLLALPRLTALRFAAEGNRFVVWQKNQGLALFEAVPSREVRSLVGNPPHTLQLLNCSPHSSRPLVAASSQFHAAVFDLEIGEDRVDVALADCAGAFLSEDANTLLTVCRAGVEARAIVRTNDSALACWQLWERTSPHKRPATVPAAHGSWPRDRRARSSLTSGTAGWCGSFRLPIDPPFPPWPPMDRGGCIVRSRQKGRG